MCRVVCQDEFVSMVLVSFARLIVESLKQVPIPFPREMSRARTLEPCLTTRLPASAARRERAPCTLPPTGCAVRSSGPMLKMVWVCSAVPLGEIRFGVPRDQARVLEYGDFRHG